MSDKDINNVNDVARWRLCLGCGACVSVCPKKAITLVDIPVRGIRPIADVDKCQKCSKCLQVCPAIGICHQNRNSDDIVELSKAWGSVLEIWEGYASDSDIRFKGSSGGAVTALSIYMLESGAASSVLHIGTKESAPLQSIPMISKTRSDLIAQTGSRYAPAPTCAGFSLIDEQKAPAVFVGKPCDIVALTKARSIDEQLDLRIACSISIFCAGTPATVGTYKILSEMRVNPERVKELRYRGNGWPGMTVAMEKDSCHCQHMTYEEAWGRILSKFGQFRCRLCPDSTGEFADISCGDPWYRQTNPNDPGRSLILVRTELGKKILHGAIAAGHIEAERVEPSTLWRSQRTLLRRKRHLWARLTAMRIMQIPLPEYLGFNLFSNWLDLSFIEKIRSFSGTIRRIIARKWYKALASESLEQTMPAQTATLIDYENAEEETV